MATAEQLQGMQREMQAQVQAMLGQHQREAAEAQQAWATEAAAMGVLSKSRNTSSKGWLRLAATRSRACCPSKGGT